MKEKPFAGLLRNDLNPHGTYVRSGSERLPRPDDFFLGFTQCAGNDKLIP